MLPADHLLDPTAGMCPALVIMRLPGGGTHFIVSWRRHGGAIQIMDPAIGRRWVSEQRFLESVYMHTAKVPASTWRAWAASEPVLAVTRARLARMGIDWSHSHELRSMMPAGKVWQPSTRAVALLPRCCVQGGANGAARRRTCSAADQRGRVDSAPILVSGIRRPRRLGDAWRGAAAYSRRAARGRQRIVAFRTRCGVGEHPSRPGRELCRLMREDGILAPSVVAAALVLAGAGVVLEAVLLRGFLEIGRELPFLGERIAATVAMGSWLLICCCWTLGWRRLSPGSVGTLKSDCALGSCERFLDSGTGIFKVG